MLYKRGRLLGEVNPSSPLLLHPQAAPYPGQTPFPAVHPASCGQGHPQDVLLRGGPPTSPLGKGELRQRGDAGTKPLRIKHPGSALLLPWLPPGCGAARSRGAVLAGRLWALLPGDGGGHAQGDPAEPHSPALTPSPSVLVAGRVPIPISQGCVLGIPDPEAPWGAAGLLPTQVEREQELHGRLRHRHVVCLHGHFADHRHIYLLLEYCSRRSLADILRARGRLTEPEVRYYLLQVISGLRYLHGEGIVHRDLKLSNFLVTEKMQVKIGDLGLARQKAPLGQRWGALCGTPSFLAPEVLDRKGHGVPSDVWALGCAM
uniref:Protein kinase domain-containing protein n=1 Tax=Amazona collaria TaxID=241587 RepID=A0A8B9F3X8_9PSIT